MEIEWDKPVFVTKYNFSKILIHFTLPDELVKFVWIVCDFGARLCNFITLENTAQWIFYISAKNRAYN